MHLTNIQLYST